MTTHVKFERLALTARQRSALSGVLVRRRYEGLKACLLGGVAVFILLFLYVLNTPALAAYGVAALAFAVIVGVIAGLVFLLVDSLYWHTVLSRETGVIRATGSFDVRRESDVEGYPLRTIRADRSLRIPEDAPEIARVSAIDYTGRAGYVLALFDLDGRLVYQRGTYQPTPMGAGRSLADSMASTQ